MRRKVTRTDKRMPPEEDFNWKRLETRDPTKARRYEGFKAGRQEERKAGKRQDHAAVAHYP
ncbi:hypothetical protein JMJ77_0012949, partial [Colletotrichum scovillei]